MDRLGAPGQLDYALLHKGHLVEYAHGDYVGANRMCGEAPEALQDLGDKEGIVHAAINLAGVTLELGGYPRKHSELITVGGGYPTNYN